MTMIEALELPSEDQDEVVDDRESFPDCRSHLVLDLGSSYTVATLYDIVEGQYRFISRGISLTTAGAPWYDVQRGFRSAVNQVSESTGRILVNSRGFLISPRRHDGSGVDCFGMVVSAAEPLKTLLIGLLEDASLESALRAIRTIYSLEVDRFSLSDDRSEHSKLESLLKREIDLVVIVGGSDGSADERLLEQVDTLSIGLNLLDDFRRPQIIYAANSDLQTQVLEKLDGIANIHLAENVRPTVDYEDLDDIIGLLATAYSVNKVNKIAGIQALSDACTMPVLPAAHAFGGITQYLAAVNRGKVVGLDIGSGSATMVVSDPKNVELVIRSDLGLGEPIVNVLNSNGFADIFKWTDGLTRATEVRDIIYNKSLMPQTLPQDSKELAIEQAISGLLAKEAATGLTVGEHITKGNKLKPIKLLVLRGGILTKSPSPGPPILSVIDGIQPTGVFRVVLDVNDILPAMGLLASHNPQLVVQVLDSNTLLDSGWIVVADGQADLGKAVLRITLEVSGEPADNREIKFGDLVLIQLAPGKVANMTLQPAPNFDVGKGPGQQAKHRISGGVLGLLIDARGRPINIEGDEAYKRKIQQQWMRVVAS